MLYRETNSMKSTYIPDTEYAALVARLMAAPGALDPESEIKIAIGELAGVWPQSIREDADAA